MSTTLKIGLISDTHGHLPKAVNKLFKNTDAIIHAGDIGNQSILRQLERLAPVTAVRGNSDSGLIASFLEDVEIMNLNGYDIAVMHKQAQAQPLMAKSFKGVIIFGHTHNPEIFKDQGILFINPGSPSQPRTLDYGTVALLTLDQEQLPAATFHKVESD